MKAIRDVTGSMVNSALHTLSAVFALVAATGAGVVSVLVWRMLQESPFGRVVALLSVTMSGLIAYHAVLFVVGPEPVGLDALRSGLHTVLAIFLWLAIATHERVQDSAAGGR